MEKSSWIEGKKEKKKYKKEIVSSEGNKRIVCVYVCLARIKGGRRRRRRKKKLLS